MLNQSKALSIINNMNLQVVDNLKQFIIDNKKEMDINDLSLIIELSNTNRKEQSAYYTNGFLIKEIIKHIPDFNNKDEINIIEPSVGAGNFIPYLFEKYKNKKKVNLTVVDINEITIELLKELYSSENIPSNFNINFCCEDFMLHELEHVDLVIGNPPFTKLKSDYIKKLNNKYCNETKNLAGLFIEKSLLISDYVSLIMPKNILNTSDYSGIRRLIKNKTVDYIIDFGDKGFKGVLVETLGIFISNNKISNTVNIISIPKKINIIQRKEYIFDHKLPHWVIYRNNIFDNMFNNMKFGIFNSFRDRQITNSNSILIKNNESDIRVIKSRNISDDGCSLIDIVGYDSYIPNNNIINKYNVSKFLNNDSVYLTPNMTYNPRVMQKQKGYLVNGSVAILIPKYNFTLTKEQMLFFSTKKFRDFYAIARNYQTRSLNIDNTSCYWFGIMN